MGGLRHENLGGLKKNKLSLGSLERSFTQVQSGMSLKLNWCIYSCLDNQKHQAIFTVSPGARVRCHLRCFSGMWTRPSRYPSPKQPRRRCFLREEQSGAWECCRHQKLLELLKGTCLPFPKPRRKNCSK